MKVIDMRVRIPRKLKSEDKGNFMAYYQNRAGFDLHYEADSSMLVSELAEAMIEKAVLHSEWEYEDPCLLNESVSNMVSHYPGTFFAVVSVDPRKGVSRSVKDLRDAIAGTVCVGLGLQPAFFDMMPDDARLYPLYQVCEESRIPVWLHTGINYSPNHSMDADRPFRLEKILMHFPNIRIVACHSGWPWVGELCAVARKFYPRVFLEIGGVAPKYIFALGTGWDPFLQYANSLLQDQILFGTDWPIIAFKRGIAEIEAAPLKDSVRKKILFENGMRLITETLQTKQ
jgi:uncharacterized protein